MKIFAAMSRYFDSIALIFKKNDRELSNLNEYKNKENTVLPVHGKAVFFVYYILTKD